MADLSPPDYKALFLRAEEERRRAEEERARAEKELRRAEEERRRVEEEREQERQQTRKTTFGELIRHCHNLFSRPFRVAHPSRSTTGTIPPPTGKHCPLKLRPWVDCAASQQEVYQTVCDYLEPSAEDAKRLFSPRLMLEGLGQEFRKRPISSEKDLEGYERFGVENYVRDIVTELCKDPAARDRFNLGNGIRFDNHANALDLPEVDTYASESSTYRRSRPDQFCIRRIDGESSTLLTTVEYKPPHKLPVEILRSGLRSMDFCEEVVWPDSIPIQEPEKLLYKAARLTGSAVVQEFHVMIQEGLEYSYLTNGLALVLLRVPYEDPSTLYYHLCEPNFEVNTEDEQSFQKPLTTIARAMCLCLMSFGSTIRDQEWRDRATKLLPKWETSFDKEYSQVPTEEFQQIVHSSPYNPSKSTSSGRSSSAWVPSSPDGSPTDGRRPPTRSQTQSQTRCAPSDPICHDETSDSDEDPTLRGQKRRFSQVPLSPSSPSAQRSSRRAARDRDQLRSAQFCTQRCLLGLQKGGSLDECCPNVTLHRRGGSDSRHLINAGTLVQNIKQQLDRCIDDCTPMGGCGASGAPFKLTCFAFGYTLVGKGTTSGLWKEVSREADVYRILSRVQGSAVPVFLGAIDLAKTYFLHGAGPIRHMLLMAWGGEPISTIKDFRREIARSIKDVRSLGIIHQDLREDNLLWNAELGRVLIIDFHRSALDHRPMKKRGRPHERVSCDTETGKQKRSRVG